MSEKPKIDPASIGYPANDKERETYERSISRRGSTLLTESDVMSIQQARRKRASSRSR